MTDFLFKRLVILSRTEKRAKCINFDPHSTILTGPNHLGKSAILKTLFWTFGAESRQSETWKAARIASLLYISIKGVDYVIMRESKEFTVFDSAGKVIGQFNKITRELAPFLARLFGFGLRLSIKGEEQSVTPPPAFYFLPYYFDQDASWTKSWDSFKGLEQMRNWKADVADYHTGIKPNAYYDLGSEQIRLMKIRDDTQAELDMVKRIRDELSGQLEAVSFQIDLAAFEEEITLILKDCEKIQITADSIRNKLVTLHNDRILIDAQIDMVASSLKELGKDYQFLKSAGDHVNCPLCQASYPSDFSNVFEIALDQDRCEEVLSRLREELSSVNADIASESAKHSRHEAEIARIRALLAKKKEQVSLSDLIESQSKKEVTSRLKGKIDILNTKLFEAQSTLEGVKLKLKALVSKERKRDILSFFGDQVRRNLKYLGVPQMADKAWNRIAPTITVGGSYQPRALLAYGFAILATIRERFAGDDACLFAPIVIDSPIQQDQDTDNHLRIMEFIRTARPKNTQLIVAVVDSKGVDYGGTVIELNNAKRTLLSGEEFSDASREMDPYLHNAFAFGQGTLL